jgi:DNA-directed RNA polymerase subunit RPC12/RpoP
MSAQDDRPAEVCTECQADHGSGMRAAAEASAPEAECPKCHGDRLVEYDAILRAFACGVCSHQWRPRAPQAEARR